MLFRAWLFRFIANSPREVELQIPRCRGLEKGLRGDWRNKGAIGGERISGRLFYLLIEIWMDGSILVGCFWIGDLKESISVRNCTWDGCTRICERAAPRDDGRWLAVPREFEFVCVSVCRERLYKRKRDEERRWFSSLVFIMRWASDNTFELLRLMYR